MSFQLLPISLTELIFKKAAQSFIAGVIRIRAEDPDPAVLSRAQCEFYNKNGYIVLPNALAADEATELLDEARNVMTRISEDSQGIIRHNASSSGDETPFLIGRVLATFEFGQYSHLFHMQICNLEPTLANDRNLKPSERPIARLGCRIHQNIPSFGSVTHSAHNRSIAKSLNYEDPRVTQSQLVAKLAGAGGRVILHQDEPTQQHNILVRA